MFVINIRLKCEKAILENGGILKSASDCYKNQEMCNEAVDNYPHALEFVPECFMTQEICNKAVNRCFFVFDFIPDWYKTQEMCASVVSEDPFLIVQVLINIKLKECVMKLLLIL